MHIPDGYLSPSTCAVLYAAAVAVLARGAQRVRRALDARMCR